MRVLITLIYSSLTVFYGRLTILFHGLTALCFGLTALALSSCTISEDQLQFEQEAYRVPAGYTKTNERGIIVLEDPDDWRIAPMFTRLVSVEPIFPNPTKGDDLRIQVFVERTEAVFGLYIVRVDPKSYPYRLIPLYRNMQSPVPPGLLNINIPFKLIFPQHPILDERGLHRILIFDGRDNIISYGDLMLE